MTKRFGTLPDGRDVSRLELNNEHLKVGILAYGASVQSVQFKALDVLLGSDQLEDYLGPLKYFGAIVGRVANRIAGARAVIDGKECRFDVNEPNGNCLHGGSDGTGQQLWTVIESSADCAVLSLELPDGHMGFPGAMQVTARYELCDATLRLEITSKTDKETLCAFAPHGYWNLCGATNINAHTMRVAAQHYLPIDVNNIPTGDIAPVDSTDFDFTDARVLAQTELDHNFCISCRREALRPVLWLVSPTTGITLVVASTESGVQVYDGRHMGRAGLAIEPQVWPDAINQDGFPNMVLKPGETYQAVSEFRFSQSAHT